jgi:hypothetical protein
MDRDCASKRGHEARRSADGDAAGRRWGVLEERAPPMPARGAWLRGVKRALAAMADCAWPYTREAERPFDVRPGHYSAAMRCLTLTISMPTALQRASGVSSILLRSPAALSFRSSSKVITASL